MNNTFDHKTLSEIEGNLEHEEQVLTRTPLHVEFSGGTNFASATEITRSQRRSKTVFNAIGSRCVGTELHLPVIDIDGGVKISRYRSVPKAVLGCAYEARYTADNDLRDVLFEHDIDLEVFTNVRAHYRPRVGNTDTTQDVSHIVLRGMKSSMFDAVDSTQRGHSHFYLNEPFTDDEHQALIEGLVGVGAVSPAWMKMTQMEGMSIVRTPWTRRDLSHLGS